MQYLFRVLAGILLMSAPLSALAETVEEEEAPADTPATPVGELDLHQDVRDDLFGEVSRFDATDFKFHPDDHSFTIVFWADGLNGSWIADNDREDAPTPPFRVFVGRLPQGSVDKKYLNNKWRDPEAFPLLPDPNQQVETGKTPQASPDNVAWGFRIKGRGTKTISFNIRMVDATGRAASGNIIQKSDFYIGGDQCRYQMELDFDNGTVSVTD